VTEALASRLQWIVAVAAAALLGYGLWLAQQGRPDADRRILLTLGVLGVAAYFNFGALHFFNFIHNWDTYHYFIGAKYFPELGYDRLYACTAIADAEALGLEKVKARVITELKSNVRILASQVLEHPDECRSHFPPERWAEFSKDVAFFRSRVSTERWNEIQRDHGYNATPVWNALGHVLANLGPASIGHLTFLALLDPLLLALMGLLIFKAFGWRTLAVCAVLFGTFYPSRFYWTGGAFLRHDWLALLVASVCLLKLERPYLAGAALGYSALLRLFPALAVGGIALAFVGTLVERKRLDPRLMKFAAGAVAALAVLLPVSFAMSGRNGYERFIENTMKHAATPLTNHMGLKTVVSYRPSKAGHLTWERGTTDPSAKWRQGRIESFQALRPLFWVAIAAFLALIYRSLRKVEFEPWMALAMGTMLIAVGAELTCYYYCFAIAVALLHSQRPEVGFWLFALSVVVGFIGWAPLPFMSSWDDEKYTAMSVATLFAFTAVLEVFATTANKKTAR
jgi:hypothetical protein